MESPRHSRHFFIILDVDLDGADASMDGMPEMRNAAYYFCSVTSVLTL